jgi:hypothetical protein
MKKGILIVCFVAAGLVTVLLFLANYGEGCSFSSNFNPEIACHVHDEAEERVLIEYFDVDTNELRLYIQKEGVDTLIEHPYGKVSRFSPNLQANEIRLDRSDSRFLIVNGERFPITIK